MWQGLNEEERAPYNEQAEQDKVRYKKQNDEMHANNGEWVDTDGAIYFYDLKAEGANKDADKKVMEFKKR